MRFPRIKITLRRMMVGVAVAALLLYGYVSSVDSVRQRRMQAVRTLYLAKARGHASLVKHWRWGARRRLDAVPNCLKLARQQRLWLPVAPDPEVESLAVQWEMR